LDPDILHAHYVTNYGFFGALCGFHPFVLTAWGSDVLFHTNRRVLAFVKEYIAKYVLRKADLTTCDADHMKEAIRMLGVSTEKIILVYFGIDTRKFSPGQRSESLRTRLGFYGSPAVVSLRNLEPLYDVESLFRAMPSVLKEIPETKFVIAGKGSEEGRLRDLASSLGVIDSIRFIGFIPNDELPQYLNAMDVYVSTSLSDAGIAASTAEAMACGLPVIITDVADNRMWVEDGENGFIIPMKDPEALAEKIVYLLRHKDIGSKFGERNRKIIEERNDYYKEMGKMEKIYQELAERRKK
jgi:glycosyltransferase involved in cell wall biosynthesis